MTDKTRKFRMENQYSDGTKDEPELHKIEDIQPGWRMGRRDFLATTAFGLAAVSLSAENLFADDSKSNLFGGIPSGDCNDSVYAHGGKIAAVKFLPGMENIVSVSNSKSPFEKSIKIWDWPGRGLVKSVDAINVSSNEKFYIEGINTIKADLKSRTLPANRESDEFKKISEVVLGESELARWDYDYKAESYINLYSGKRALVIGSYLKKIVVISALENKILHTIQSKSLTVKGFVTRIAAVDNDEKLLALYDNLSVDYTLIIWDMQNKKQKKIRRFNDYQIISMLFSADAQKLYAGCSDGFIRVYKTDTLETILEIGNKKSYNSDTAISLSSSGDLIASACSKFWGRKIIVAELPSGKIIQSIDDYASIVEFSPDGELLACGTIDGRIQIREIRDLNSYVCLFDPAVLDEGKSVNQYEFKNSSGKIITFTGSGKANPAGSVCVCNSVNGTYKDRNRQSSGGGGGTYCTCNQVCTCVPVK